MLTVLVLAPTFPGDATFAEDPQSPVLPRDQNKDPDFPLPDDADYHASFMMVGGHLDDRQVPFLEGGNDKLGCISDVYHGSRKVFGRGQTFLDLFQLDVYAAQCQGNLYYPFANLGDWEIANFLLMSRLSMRAIDQLLSLPLVSSFLLLFYSFSLLNSFIDEFQSYLVFYRQRTLFSC